MLMRKRGHKMTNQEAVDILRHTDIDFEVDTDKYLEAFDMAVNCLEKSTEIAKSIREGKFPSIFVVKKGGRGTAMSTYMKGWNDGLEVAAEVIETAWQPLEDSSGSSPQHLESV